ncbi:MAG: amidase domain-containing protein [Lachnospiraceae bacterium]
MSKKLIKVLTIIMANVLIMANVTVMAADEKANNEIVSTEYVNKMIDLPPLLAGIGSISVKENLLVNEISVPLYCTFDSQEEALTAISDNPVIQMIQAAYDYEDISDATWQQYFNAMHEIFDSAECPAWYTESNEDIRRLRQFFDIYENKEQNDEIKSLINSAMRVSDVLQNEELLLLLPYESYLILSQQSSVLNNEKSLAASTDLRYNANDGFTYACQYAVNPNKNDYDYFQKDCTNFVSQILEHSGVQQVVYDSEASGWWHKVTSGILGTKHTHSISWVRADTFARYMGVGYTTQNHISFTGQIKSNDFIVADFTDDGNWDHMGYASQVSPSLTPEGYHNYRVAQHTSNYHEWANSSKNNWDNIEGDGGRYGRVRR